MSRTTAEDHDHPEIASLGVGIITVSSSRSAADDEGGNAIAAILEEHGHTVETRNLVRDERETIQESVRELVEREAIDCVITTGGTGVTRDDVTIEALVPLFEKELPGFGELFRHLSYEEVGTRIVATRAVGGISKGVPIFCLPGSTNAVSLATREIIVEETPHLAGLATRHDFE
jgi:molybdenum cofactor biosynthesis protein B